MPRPARPSSDARPIPTKKHITQQSVDAAVWAICDVMRRGNVASSLQYVPELTWILFLRILDEQEEREAGEAEALGHGYEGSLAVPYRWADWARPIDAKAARGETNTRRELTEAGAGKFLEFVNARLIPHLKGLRDRPFRQAKADREAEAMALRDALAGQKKARPRDEAAITATQMALDAATRATREAANKAQAIEDAVYDLKAVNPNKKADLDTRTPAELLDLIEEKGREVAAALAALRELG